MKLRDYIQVVRNEQSAEGPGIKEEDRARLRELLYKEVSSARIAQLLSERRDAARIELAASIDQILRINEFPDMSLGERNELIEDTLDLVLGLGPIEKLLKDDTVTEIMVNGHKSVFFERAGVLHSSNESFASEEQLRLVVDRIVSPLGRRVDEQSPIVNARLTEGHRVNVVIPPLALNGTTVTIRKFRAAAYTLDELVEMNTLSADMAQLLKWAVQSRKNIAVSGGTGGGKTTLLNALSRLIAHSERIVTIEDSAELRFDDHPHVVRLEARMANAEGHGAISIRDLVINALRMRPDRIVVGECRGAEALDMLQAMNTGHDGSLTTLHANSPAEVVPRLVMMARYGMDLPTEIIEAQIISALDLIVQQDRMSGGKRRITQIAIRNTVGQAHGHVQRRFYTPVVEWDRRAKRYIWSKIPDWVNDLPYIGVADVEEVHAWCQSVQCCS